MIFIMPVPKKKRVDNVLSSEQALCMLMGCHCDVNTTARRWNNHYACRI